MLFEPNQFEKIKNMQSKWRIYLIALFSYSSIHAIRTMWSAMKSDLNGDPYHFEVSFLGTLDMLVLFILAIFMNIFGPKLQSWGIKKTLILSMVVLAVLTFLLALFLCSDITSPWVYVLFFSLGVGFFSSVGWPCCLCIVSCYFDKGDGVALSAYNGTSQLGDFTSLITYYGVLKWTGWPPQASFFLSSFYLIVYIALISFFFPNDHQKIEKVRRSSRQSPLIQLSELKFFEKESNQKLEVSHLDQKQEETRRLNQKKEEQSAPSRLSGSNEVTIVTVWLLPGVALNVLAYGFIKAINSFIVGWLVYYLLGIGLGAQSILITILWSAFIFLGGIASAYFNKQYSKKIFILQMLIALICFIFLQKLHSTIYRVEIILALIVCAFFYGGPYNLMSTAIPIMLGSQPQVVKYSNGKGAVISLMEGYGQFFCGISLLIVPLFGVNNINGSGAVFCAISVILLGLEMIRERSAAAGSPDQRVRGQT